MTNIAAPIGENANQEINQPISTALGAAPAETNNVTATWPDSWRNEFAEGDPKLLSQLERFTTPKDVAKSWREAQKKISSGEFKQALPKDATPEDLAAWRKNNGVPENAEGYLEAFSKSGFIVGENDKENVSKFLSQAHELNLPPEAAQKLIDWDMQNKQAQLEQQTVADKAFEQEATDILRQEWGSDYRVNVNIIDNLLSAHAPQGYAEKLRLARSADGVLLGNDPDTLKFLANLARSVNPVATLVPGIDSQTALTSEIEQIQKIMKTDINAYRKDPKMQARYAELLQAQSRIKG